MISKEELKTFYNSLESNFEGYVQMSNEPLETFYSKPSWEDIHETNNFIFEAALFDGDRSILIRQINDLFLVVDRCISEFPETSHDVFFAKENKKVKMVHVWEAKEDEYCENMKVLKPTLTLFAGFEGERS